MWMVDLEILVRSMVNKLKALNNLMCVKQYYKAVLQEIPSFLVTSHKPLQENKNAESAEIVNQKRTNSCV